MFKIFCVTNSTLAIEGGIDPLTRFSEIAAAKPDGIILREKNLSADDYKRLAEGLLEASSKYGVPVILHSFQGVAKELGVSSLHMPLDKLSSMTCEERKSFRTLGSSCHSVSDAVLAEGLGCNYIIAGHIYPTDCKKGLPSRGVGFLSDISSAVKIPVYAIGGIAPEKIPELVFNGADGAAVMSALMTLPNKDSVQKYISALRLSAEEAEKKARGN